MNDSETPSTDPRLSIAIENAINKCCEQVNCNLDPKMRADMKRRIERRIENGDPGDYAFAMEARAIK